MHTECRNRRFVCAWVRKLCKSQGRARAYTGNQPSIYQHLIPTVNSGIISNTFRHVDQNKAVLTYASAWWFEMCTSPNFTARILQNGIISHLFTITLKPNTGYLGTYSTHITICCLDGSVPGECHNFGPIKTKSAQLLHLQTSQV